MISSLRGTIVSTDETGIFVAPEGVGIEFYAHVADSALFASGAAVHVFTHMHWNQEQGPALYAFKTAVERNLFLMLIDCSGVGPKLALSILAQMQPAEFAGVVQREDLRALSSLKGIGAKKAEQLMLFCRHKIDQFLASSPVDMPGSMRHSKGIADVLYSLNYGRAEVQRALTYVHQKSYEGEPTFDQLMRDALASLAKRA